MKKLLVTSVIALSTATCFASDYLPQQVTSEVYTEQTQVVEENYQQKQINYRP